ncbi:MAG: type II secretion system protein N [Desulfobacteraceae bacterium]|jgi:general secretion pathway protein C
MESKTRIPAKLLIVSNVLLCSLIGLVLTEVIITFLQNREEDHSTVQVASAVPRREPSRLATLKRASGLRPIIAGDIFKTHQQTETSRTPVVKTIDPTQLDLRLKGTVVGEGAPAFAVIQDGKTREQNVYRVGDEISGARITGITWDDVILDVERKHEALRMEEETVPTHSNRKAPPPKPTSK